MPSSTWAHISTVGDVLNKEKPKTILDIGVGFGRWGSLCREILDVFAGRYYLETWKTHIEGIEIFPEYIQPWHKIFYNKIHIGDALEILTRFKKEPRDLGYDLIIAGDVLEHFDKEQGKLLLSLIKSLSKVSIVCVPIGPKYPQGPTFKNTHETHQAVWEYEDFEPFKPSQVIRFTERIRQRPYGVIIFR